MHIIKFLNFYFELLLTSQKIAFHEIEPVGIPGILSCNYKLYI